MIEFHQVTFQHHEQTRPVLDRVSLSIQAGEWVSIVGANGSGKSTLLKLIDGLLMPTDGVIMVDGTILNRDTVYEVRRQIGFVFQNPENQFVGQTVQDDIVFGLENRALDRSSMRTRLNTYAEKLEVGEWLHRHPGTLSGGQMQRASLAAVLAMEPDILLFDEVTSMLDEDGRRSIMEIIRQLHDEKRYTIVMVTHDVDEMLASDRIIALDGGRIVADGRPKEVLGNDEWPGRLGIRLPYARRLAMALADRGIVVGSAWDEKELMNELWRYDSNT